METRPWGYYEVLKQGKKFWIKTLTINPGARLSLQSHKNRDEVWTVIQGKAVVDIYKSGNTVILDKSDTIFVGRETKHRIWNDSSDEHLIICEVALGNLDENDICRYEDDYGRAK